MDRCRKQQAFSRSDEATVNLKPALQKIICSIHGIFRKKCIYAAELYSKELLLCSAVVQRLLRNCTFNVALGCSYINEKISSITNIWISISCFLKSANQKSLKNSLLRIWALYSYWTLLFDFRKSQSTIDHKVTWAGSGSGPWHFRYFTLNLKLEFLSAAQLCFSQIGSDRQSLTDTNW